MKRNYINSFAAAFILLAALLSFPLTALAVETSFEPGQDESGWGGEAELGYLMTTGNTDTQSLNARLALGNDTPRWQNGLVFESIYGAEESEETGEDVTTVQRFLFAGKTNYKFDPRNYTYGQILFEDDRFSGYEYQVTTSAGYRRIIVDRERMEWSAQIGPGYRYSRFDDDAEEEDDYESEIIIHVGTLFMYQLSETATFKQEISADSGAENTIIRSSTSLRAEIIGALAMKLSFNLKHTTNEPEDSTSTDTETALTLVYGF